MSFSDFLGGGSTAGSKINKQAKKTNQLVGQGFDQLNAVFKGGSYGTNPLATWQPGQQAFDSKGQEFKFDPQDAAFQEWYKKKKAQQGGSSLLGGGLGGLVGKLGLGALGPVGIGIGALAGSTMGKQQGGPGQGGINEGRWEKKYGQHLAKEGQLFGGQQTEKGFGPEFYKQASDAYLNFNMPQLVGQFSDARKGLDYGLADRGLLGGSAAGQQVDKLNREGQLQSQQLANNAIGIGQNLERQVNQEYAGLANQLQQSADPSRVGQQALQSAANFASPQPLQPLGSLFSNYANQYLTGKLGEQYGKLAGTGAGYSSPFGGGSNQSTSFIK